MVDTMKKPKAMRAADQDNDFRTDFVAGNDRPGRLSDQKSGR